MQRVCSFSCTQEEPGTQTTCPGRFESPRPTPTPIQVGSSAHLQIGAFLPTNTIPYARPAHHTLVLAVRPPIQDTACQDTA